jgi:hypothetical protein
MAPPVELSCSIEDLPDEVIEYILKLISPYADFTACTRFTVIFRIFIQI